MPVQDYPPRDKVCDYHEKTASSSPIAKDCQACWRGGPPLISCRERLNAGAHSPPYTHTQGNTMTHTHIVTRMLILIHMCTYAQMHGHAYTTVRYAKTGKSRRICYLYDEYKGLEPVKTEPGVFYMKPNMQKQKYFTLTLAKNNNFTKH